MVSASQEPALAEPEVPLDPRAALPEPQFSAGSREVLAATGHQRAVCLEVHGG